MSFHDWLFPSGFMPHGHCYLWRTDVLWLHVGSDALIAASYFAIPLAVGHFVRLRRAVTPYWWVPALFAAFIFLCGSTHLMNIWTVWNPDYVLDGYIKLGTGIISAATAVMTYAVLPKALALRGPIELQREVDSRTAELQRLNSKLRDEIAARERTEISLRESEARFRILADNAPVLVWHADAQNRRIGFNQQWLDFTGRTMQQELGTGWIECIHPEDVERVVRTSQEHADRRQPFEMEFRMRRHDDTYRWVLDRGVPNFTESDRSFAGYIGSCIDITERKQMEREMRASRAELTFVTDNAPVMLAHCDRDSRYIFVNRAYTERLGKRVDEVIGRRIDEVVGQAAYAAVEPYIRRVLAGEAVEFEIEVPYETLRTRFMHYIYVPDRDESSGVVHGLVAAISDITDRRRLEDQLRDADRRKDEFLAVLAHELRNPLAPMKNAVHFLNLKSPREPALQNALQIVERQVSHMARLVDDLLEISRITGGRIRLQREPLNLTLVVTNAVEACRPAIDDARQILSLSISDEPLYVEGDVVRLSQVVTNLLNNANKYTPAEGRIAIAVRRDKEHALVSISDTGIGISPDMRERIFEMFVQVESAHEHSRGGLGVGLTLAKRLVELHGGRIDLESEGEHRGSTFTICLPLLERTSAPQTRPQVEVADPRPARVLIADDNVDAASSLAVVLQSLGHAVEIAHDGVAAVEIAERFRPDIAILDIGMPHMDGYEAARRIRQSIDRKECLLVALTGWGQDEDKRRARDAGFDEHLTKPVDPAQLLMILAANRAGDDVS